jgi:ABC-type oligopeptide transport system substrate-binding subunit/class 3 adenylate cyclase
MADSSNVKREKLEQAIAALEAQRRVLGDDVVDAALEPLQKELATLEGRTILQGERKPVTIMFADLTGFTALSETLDAETVRTLMNDCFERLVPVVDKYGGTVDKFIGDEIMALFGAPIAQENAPEQALRAALEMHQVLKQFNEERGMKLHLHFGINTGLVIAGGIGTQQHRQYSVMGDAVNVANRLVDLSEAGQIHVGEETYRLTAHLFEFIPLPPVTLKGKSEPQRVFLLHGLKLKPGRLRGLERIGLRAPLVGRETELHRLQSVIKRLQEGQGGVVSIMGEAGVGKSRLVAELRHRTDLPWYEGRCLSYGQTLSYHPFLNLLRNLAGVTSDSSFSGVEKSLRELLHSFHMDDAYPYLADLLGLPLDSTNRERLEYLASESRQWQTFQVIETLLSHLAGHKSTVIVFEDLHWVDPTSLTLLEQLVPLADRYPLLFLLVLRPHSSPLCEKFFTQLRQASYYEEIQLSPLSPEHSSELMTHLLAIEALPEETRLLILDHAEGNPLFLEEIIRTLIDQGILQREEDRWRVAPGTRLEYLNLPPTLQGVILARLDQLEAETKTVLQMAAVIGRIFWYRILNYIASVEHLLDYHLNYLEQVELIRQTRQHPDLEYIFKHVLIQDAAYRSLLREQRRRFHRRVAEAIETIFADNLEEQYGLLAHHYEASGDSKRAVHYLQLAGDRARRAYALAEARAFYERALAILPSDQVETRHRLFLGLGLVDMTEGKFEQASEHYAAAFRSQRLVSTSPITFASRPLRFYHDIPPRSLEPAISIDLISAVLVKHLFVGLVVLDGELNVMPLLADRWEVNSRGDKYRFHLRSDARWSDGAPITAHDFVYAWRRHLDPAVGAEYAFTLQVLRGGTDYFQGRINDPSKIGVRALDDDILEVELESPVACFLPMLTSGTFSPLPRHRWPPERSPRQDPSGFVGNGPFRLVEWSDQRLVMERNPFYCGTSQGNVKRFEVIFPQSGDPRLEMFLSDRVDICQVWSDSVPNFESQVLREQLQSIPALSTTYCRVVSQLSPLDDRRVRQALVRALDRSRLVPLTETLIRRPARGGFIPPGMPGHSPELDIYDPDLAKALLREAGYASGADFPPLRFASPQDEPTPLMRAMAAQWNETLGIEFVFKSGSVGELADRAQNDLPHLYIISWNAEYPDPHYFMGQPFLSPNNIPGRAYQERVQQAVHTLDARSRMKLYHELDRQLVLEEALCIPLAYNQLVLAHKPYVHLFSVSVVTGLPTKDIVIED